MSRSQRAARPPGPLCAERRARQIGIARGGAAFSSREVLPGFIEIRSRVAGVECPPHCVLIPFPEGMLLQTDRVARNLAYSCAARNEAGMRGCSEVTINDS